MNRHLVEKEINYAARNSYSTLNELSAETKTIWFVCHGMGYLSRYFLKYFKDLDPTTNYIIAPQAPSKYYQQPKMHVGANWLTRDNTQMGIDNVMNYFDSIFEEELSEISANLVVFGYSQGVSVAMRYLASRKIQCKHLVLHSGGIPKELTPSDFDYLSKQTLVTLVYGTHDDYLDSERIEKESKKAKQLFENKLIIKPFEGGHIVNQNFIRKLEV